MRLLFVKLHRWFGLAAAAFLFVAGLTGALISWQNELDAWLNPDLFVARTAGAPLPALELARRVEAADPRLGVEYMALDVSPGEALVAYVEPRLDPATHKPYALDFNQVAIDPATGEIQGRREWGAVSLARHDLMPFIYRLHYSLHLPSVGGYDVGVLSMGVIAIAWVFDTLVALWISFPGWKAWRRSFAFRWRAGGHRLVFDLHRSGGVWLFLLVLMIAVTSVSMNLNAQVMRPLVSAFSTLAPSPFAGRKPMAPGEARLTPAQAIGIATLEGRRRGVTAPAGGLSVSPESGLYGVGLFARGNDRGSGLGNPWIYVDMRGGAIVAADVPGTGSAGDIFLQAMFPLHSGRIIGFPGRVLMSAMGVAIAMFSVTGVAIWARKRKARQHAAKPRAAAPRESVREADLVATRGR